MAFGKLSEDCHALSIWLDVAVTSRLQCPVLPREGTASNTPATCSAASWHVVEAEKDALCIEELSIRVFQRLMEQYTQT